MNIWNEDINKHVEWGGDSSTQYMPVSGKKVEKFIRETLQSKLGYIAKIGNKYYGFSDIEDYNLYIQNPEQYENLILQIWEISENTIILESPIYYHKFTNKEEPIPINYESFITELIKTDRGGYATISIDNHFLYLAVPNNITLIQANTSRSEILDLENNFIVDIIPGYKVWKYIPAVAPENLSITFLFSL